GAAIAAAATWWLVARPAREAKPAGGGTTAIAGDAPIDLGDGVTAVATPGALVRWQRVAGDGADPQPELAITQSAGAVEYRSRGGARLRLATPLAVVDAGPEPVRLSIAPRPAHEPATEEDPVDKRSLAIGGAALVAAGVVVAVYEGKAHVRPTAGAPRTVEAGQQVAFAPEQPPAPPRPTPVAHATRDRGLREQVAKAIVAAQARRAAQAGSTPARDAGAIAVGADTDEAAPLPLKKEEIRDGVRETIPMLTDCYQQELLDKGVMVDGKVVAHLIVETEPDIGTVVSIDDQQPTELDFAPPATGSGSGSGSGGAAVELTSPAGQAAMKSFDECLGATLESVVLPPMRSDGTLAVTYPFVFASDDGSDDEDGQAAGSGSGSATAPHAPPATPPTTTQRTVAPPAIPMFERSAVSLLSDADDAAHAQQWQRALLLAEQALTAPGHVPEQDRSWLIAGLAACHVHDAKRARRYYQLVPGRQPLIRQVCLHEGLDPAE
ncbi:MAG TPA: hypothetical protein VHE35_16305, partial [Kofleriaceae bacterium]|nr:hypothetical protein [Kofleriaceae bacterium]